MWGNKIKTTCVPEGRALNEKIEPAKRLFIGVDGAIAPKCTIKKEALGECWRHFAVGMLVYSAVAGLPLRLPYCATGWLYVAWLAIVPGILALVLMVYSAKYIGSTATAILGALEPLTAVMIGVWVFAEPTGINLLLGIVLILISVGIITLSKR